MGRSGFIGGECSMGREAGQGKRETTHDLLASDGARGREFANAEETEGGGARGAKGKVKSEKGEEKGRKTVLREGEERVAWEGGREVEWEAVGGMCPPRSVT